MSKRIQRIKEWARNTERGATAVVVAFAMLMLMGAGAMGFDISKLLYERQEVRASIDAAAQAGASALPDTNKAKALAISYFSKNFPDAPALTYPANIAFYCVVANNGSGAPKTAQIPDTCDPGTYNASQVKCSATSCAIPCDLGEKCNTMAITYAKTVDFVFGPAINVPTGNTGAQTTLSCLGSCGGEAPPNPMNVVVMADRTPSMGDKYAPAGSFTGLKSGIESMLQYMDPVQQYVAFGAIHKSIPQRTSGDIATPPSSSDMLYTYTTTTTTTTEKQRVCSGYLWNWHCEWVDVPVTKTVSNRDDRYNGVWVPVNFSNNYNDGSATTPRPLNQSTDIYKSVHNLALSSETSFVDGNTYGIGTHLAAAMKGAARYLLSPTNNKADLDASGARADLGTPKDVIIFETDGRPEELYNSNSSALSLDNDLDPASTNGETACNNLKTVATAAKARGATIITIGFGNAAYYTCGKNSNNSYYQNSGSMYVDDVLASVASPTSDGAPSQADGCTNATQIKNENTDGDNFYCAANGNDLKDVFVAAMGSLTGGTKFMAIDGLSD